jgi:hypothetical protein
VHFYDIITAKNVGTTIPLSHFLYENIFVDHHNVVMLPGYFLNSLVAFEQVFAFFYNFRSPILFMPVTIQEFCGQSWESGL